MPSSNVDVSATRKEYLRQFLVPFWLRPESALWYAHEAVLARAALGALRPPALEFGCMDAAPTFVMLGGGFDQGFDVYREVAWSEDSMHWQSLRDDYYNTSRQAAVEPPHILRRPAEGFEVGLSWKRAHLDKAARLGLHRRLVEHDPNQPLTMFEPETFATVWAPNLYWVDRIDVALRALRRVVRADGRFVTVLPDRSALDFLLYRFVDRADPQWIKDLDRGRYSNVSRQARTLEEWRQVLASAGWEIEEHVGFLPRLVLQVNDVGCRPMFPVLMHIYETLRQRCPEDWLQIKAHWIKTMLHFMEPLCETEWMERLQMEQVWHLFALRPAARESR